MPLTSLSPETFGCLIGAWLFVVGAAVGSFLNVVIYRLPAGVSIVRPRSHCPACKGPIRWFDNVPVLSWLVLRGRCRDCRAEISIRYPAVEAITAAMFLVLYVAECFSLYLFHLPLLCTLLVALLIEYDGHRPPVRLFVPALAVGALAPAVWPGLHSGPTGSLTGLAAGLLLGWLASLCCRPKQKTGLLMCLACVGLFLGWQAVCALAIATVAIHLSLSAFGRVWPGLRRIPATTWLAPATLAWILAWPGWLRVG